MKMLKIGAVLLAFGVVAPIAAQEAPKKAVVVDKNDPDRIICRQEENTGSRLGSTRHCMTARDWAEAQRQDRQDIEKIQSQRYKNNSDN